MARGPCRVALPPISHEQGDVPWDPRPSRPRSSHPSSPAYCQKLSPSPFFCGAFDANHAAYSAGDSTVTKPRMR